MSGVSLVIRIILTGLLLWGVYTETGMWTTIALGLVMVGNELAAVQMKRLRKAMEGE